MPALFKVRFVCSLDYGMITVLYLGLLYLLQVLKDDVEDVSVRDLMDPTQVRDSPRFTCYLVCLTDENAFKNRRRVPN